MSSKTHQGWLWALAAYFSWGLNPIYFRAVAGVPPLELLAHRVLWSVLLLAVLVWMTGKVRATIDALKSRTTVLLLLLTTVLIAVNWLTFIVATTTGRILDASLGYYINPLVNITLGVLFLRERLSRLSWFCTALAFAGVVYQATLGDHVPWLAFILALTFGFYGLLRKVVKVDAVSGLAVETALLLPLALAFVLSLGDEGYFSFLPQSPEQKNLSILLFFAGAVTTIPLICFTKAAKLLPLATIGFLQYISPSCQFLLAVAAYGESFRFEHAVSFGCIWTALALYSFETVWRNRRRQRERRLTSHLDDNEGA